MLSRYDILPAMLFLFLEKFSKIFTFLLLTHSRSPCYHYLNKTERRKEIESPLVEWRNRHSITQQGLARQAQISRPLLSRIEQGQSERLIHRLEVITGISNAEYQAYRKAKRKQLDLSGQRPISRLWQMDEVHLWRIEVSRNLSLPPTPGGFASLLAVSPNVFNGLYMPINLVSALKEAGALFEALPVELANAG